MLVFGHIGITTGITWLTKKTIQFAKQKQVKASIDGGSRCIDRTDTEIIGRIKNRGLLLEWANNMDIRLIFLGALLPDLIDKPLGMFILRDELSSARIFAHTILFQVILLLAALVLLFRFSKAWLFTIFFTSLWHLVLDKMWQQRSVVLWPFYGDGFVKENVDAWVEYIIKKAIFKPYAYTGEIIGIAILIVLVISLYKRRKRGNKKGIFLL